jgi:autotransporter-associated beta strand protein
LTKIGAGTLSLSGANTYTGKTIVSEGTLMVTNTSGSGTGTGVVKVNAGTLAGKGTVSGAVTIGTGSGGGAILSPGEGAGKPTTMTIQSTLTLKADSTYSCKVYLKKAKADKVITNGVTIKSGALFTFPSIGQRTLSLGTVFTVLDNTSAAPIAGTFANLPDGSTFTTHGNTFQVSYEGGDGNDLTLTVVP